VEREAEPEREVGATGAPTPQAAPRGLLCDLELGREESASNYGVMRRHPLQLSHVSYGRQSLWKGFLDGFAALHPIIV
jgi:hypothetical protein